MLLDTGEEDWGKWEGAANRESGEAVRWLQPARTEISTERYGVCIIASSAICTFFLSLSG